MKAENRVGNHQTEASDNSPGSGSQLLYSIADELISASEVSRKTGVVESIRATRSGAGTRLSGCIERLLRLGLDIRIIRAALKRTEKTGSWLVHELISEGNLPAAAYYRQVALDLGVEYSSSIEVQRIVKEASQAAFRPGRTAQLCCRQKDGGLVIYTAPDSVAEAVIGETLQRFPDRRTTFRVVEPETVQAALAKLKSEEVAMAASSKLYLHSPNMSAKFTLVSWQAFVLGMFSLGVPSAFLLWPTVAFSVFHVLVLATFMIAVFTRLAAFHGLVRGRKTHTSIGSTEFGFPMYSVLVALHKEAPVVPQIVRSMSRLDWPQSRLEVIYVCEEDDLETREALEQLQKPASHRILAVPPIGPRTKPKALNFALEQCSGELVVIYDAEDRPDPMQLREAWRRFSEECPQVACLQAPLLITNAGKGWLSCLFAAEYACHFHALLPFLDQQGAPLPLGGTSNHFRREALEKVGGWDPHNVTEDADLGIRLSRNGYRCSVIGLPTLEDAPDSLSEWIPQRTRWIKGWMQTFLVHNRDISKIYKNIGIKNLIVFEILMVCFILSPLLYIVSILIFIVIYLNFCQDVRFSFHLIYLDTFVFVAGHLSQLALSAASWRQAYGARVPLVAAFTFPAYWVIGNLAAWRAVWKLIRSPFEWEKTRHKPAYKDGQD